MAGYSAEGKTLVFVAPVGGVTAGTPVLIGGTFCVPITDADAGESFAGYVEGVHPMTKASGTTAAAGDPAYFDSTSGLIETADSATNRRVGVFAEAAAAGTTLCSVRQDGVSFGAGDADLESKVDKIALASTDAGEGASSVGLEDALGLFDDDNVEDALADLAITAEKRLASKTVVVALGAATGSSAADPKWVGAEIKAVSPISGNDQVITGASVAGDGAVTVTVAGNETAEATFEVLADLA